jgi:hypothetical protein
VKARVWISVGALAIAGILIWVVARPARDSETNSKEPTTEGPASTAYSSVTPARSLPSSPETSPPPPAERAGGAGAAAHYPVDLEDLRARLPDNRYWELGAPTSDPEVTRARAERAKRDNELFGRTQTGEATEEEIRTYYAERRRISEDYLRLSLVVLAEKSDQLPERDRGMFELSAKMHRDRLVQIERDLADALARRRERQR